MNFSVLPPVSWAHDQTPPDLVLDHTVGGAIDWIVRLLEHDGPWNVQRRAHASKVLRRFAQLFIPNNTSMHSEFMDAAYYLLYKEAKHEAAFAAQVAALHYKFNTTPHPDAQQLLVTAAHRGDVQLAQQAIGANVNQSDFNGTTPLMIAAQHRHTQLVTWLLAVGANKDATDVFGESYQQHGVLEPHL